MAAAPRKPPPIEPLEDAVARACRAYLDALADAPDAATAGVRLDVETKRCAYDEALARLDAERDAQRQRSAQAVQRSVAAWGKTIAVLGCVIAFGALVQAYKALYPTSVPPPVPLPQALAPAGSSSPNRTESATATAAAAPHISFGGGVPGGEPLAVGANDLPGGPHAVDALALASKAREVAGVGQDVGLKGIVAHHVPSTGLVDLAPSNYESRIEYWFLRKTPPGEAGAPPPLGATDPGRQTSGTEWIVHVVSTGMHAPALQHVSGDIGETVPMPRCTLARLWQAAMKAGAPKDAVATLSYGKVDHLGRSATVPTDWLFEIEDTEFSWEMSDETCGVERRASRSTFF